jgi:hypothetical protein
MPQRHRSTCRTPLSDFRWSSAEERGRDGEGGALSGSKQGCDDTEKDALNEAIAKADSLYPEHATDVLIRFYGGDLDDGRPFDQTPTFRLKAPSLQPTRTTVGERRSVPNCQPESISALR